jgi:hypothetical protein
MPPLARPRGNQSEQLIAGKAGLGVEMHRPLSRPDRGASMQTILSEVRGAGGAERDAAVRMAL